MRLGILVFRILPSFKKRLRKQKRTIYQKSTIQFSIATNIARMWKSLRFIFSSSDPNETHSAKFTYRDNSYDIIARHKCYIQLPVSSVIGFSQIIAIYLPQSARPFYTHRSTFNDDLNLTLSMHVLHWHELNAVELILQIRIRLIGASATIVVVVKKI